MDTTQYDGLWLLVYCIGLVVVFGLGAIKGGQR
ncbi:tail virion protein G7P-2 [Kushneria sp. Sum13]